MSLPPLAERLRPSTLDSYIGQRHLVGPGGVITRILFEQGYILNYKFEEGNTPAGTIKIALKYNPEDKESAIRSLKRVSRPGLRQYTGYKEMPRVLNGLGIAILSTSKGVMTNKQAKAEKIGGEVLCYVY